MVEARCLVLGMLCATLLGWVVGCRITPTLDRYLGGPASPWTERAIAAALLAQVLWILWSARAPSRGFLSGV